MNNQNGNRPKNNNEIGAAWLKQGQDGHEYIAITFKAEALQQFDLANCWISMSPNQRKSNPKQPDYRITAKPKQVQTQRQSPPQQQAKSSFPRPKNFAPQAPAPSSGSVMGSDWDDEDPGF